MQSFTCKVCFDEGTDVDDFISPCCCIGSGMHVHKKCLNEWIGPHKNSTNYFRCQDCLCEYKRAKIKGQDSEIDKRVITTSLLLESSYTIFLLVSILLCGISTIVCSIVLFFVYIITLINMLYYNSDWGYWITILIAFFAFYSSKNVKTFITDIWLILLYAFSSFLLLTEGWNHLKMNITKDFISNVPSLMFDNYTNKFVEGVI